MAVEKEKKKDKVRSCTRMLHSDKNRVHTPAPLLRQTSFPFYSSRYLTIPRSSSPPTTAQSTGLRVIDPSILQGACPIATSITKQPPFDLQHHTTPPRSTHRGGALVSNRPAHHDVATIPAQVPTQMSLRGYS